MSMRKFKVGMAAVLILGIVVLFFVVNAFAQSASERLNCPSGALSIFDVQEGINVECVNALFATLTPTIGAPTDTPVPPTSVPPSPTPAGPIEPFAGAPRCLDSNSDGHDDVTDNPFILWNSIPDNRIGHDLWNEVDGCHYNHEHKADPHLVDDIFGTEFYALAGGEISYPWQTFKGAGPDYPTPPPPGDFENDFKHEGYGWLVERDVPRVGLFGPFDYYVSDYRVQFHGIVSALGSAHRFHSFALEARLCYEGTCGLFRTGGHIDYGNLFINDEYIPLPGDNPRAENPFSNMGKRSHFTGAHEIWYSNPPQGSGGVVDPEAHRFVRLALVFFDPWGPLNPADPLELTFYCPEYDCENNDSEARLQILNIVLDDPALDPDGDGIINIDGYTDRYGYIVEGCTEPGLDCVPLLIENVPFGGVYWVPEAAAVTIDGDISPPGEFWLSYPN